MMPEIPQPRHFQPLEQTAFRGLEHAAYLKGFLKFMMIPARYFAGLRQSSIQQVYQ